MEVVEETADNNKEQTQILKGKRTKRLRPQSPIPFSIVPPVSTAEEVMSDDDDHGHCSKDKNLSTMGEDNNSNNNNNNIVCVTNGITSSSSASSSSNNVALNNNNNNNNSSNNNNNDNNNTFDMSIADEEDQDMAHCLILLARGRPLTHVNHNQLQQQPQPQPQLLTSYNEMVKNNNNSNNAYRFSSRKFLETSSSNGTGGKAGYYVYQCKTCDRTFPSFQALGGHRASHKKPKAIQADEFKKNINNEESCRYNSISIHSNNNNNNNNNRGLVVYGKVGNKVHECGICGAEFTSGQALGGHMRRHRGAVVAAAAAAAANTALSLSPMSLDQSDGQDHQAIKRVKSSAVSLDLDLNLPAPDPDDDNRVNGSHFASKQEHEPEEHKQQQQPQPQKQREELKAPLVLSAPTLVDCHY